MSQGIYLSFVPVSWLINRYDTVCDTEGVWMHNILRRDYASQTVSLCAYFALMD
jgi:uncharacterized membrane protein